MPEPLMAAAAVTDLIWIQTGFIGDIILTTGALAKAKRHLPQAKQHIITTEIGAQVLAGQPELASCIVYAKGRESPLTAMRSVRRDLLQALPTPSVRGSVVVLQAHRSYRSSLLAKFLRFPTITYRQTAWAFLADIQVERVAILHEVERLALLLGPLGAPRLDVALPSMPARALPQVSGWGQQLADWPGQVVAIAPGSVWGTKRWPEAAFAAILQRFLDRPDLMVVLLGSAAEAALVARVAKAVPQQPRLLNLAGKTTFDDLKGLYPRLSLLLANDSSPIHMASAYGVTTVALFGATVPAMGFGPLAPGSTQLGVDLACRPCSDHGPQECPLGHFKCMRELSVERVWTACSERLLA